MVDYNLIDRVTALKLEFEEDYSNSINLFKAIFSVLKNNDGLNNNQIKKVFNDYIKIHPCDGIDSQVINTIISSQNLNRRRRNALPNLFSINNPTSTISLFQNIYSNNGITNLLSIPINTSLNEENVPLLLKDSELEKLDVVSYKNLDEDLKENTKTCIFTQNEFNDEDLVTILPCKHVFNKDEINKWLTSVSYKCPTCREAAGEYYAKLN